jgi:hypothetical protein
MSMGLELYIIDKKNFMHNEIYPSHIITLDETYLIEYFIDGDGRNYVHFIPPEKRIYVLACDEEMPTIVNENPYGEKLSYVYGIHFDAIPKEIIKKETQLTRAAIKFIKKIPNSIVVLYYT